MGYRILHTYPLADFLYTLSFINLNVPCRIHYFQVDTKNWCLVFVTELTFIRIHELGPGQVLGIASLFDLILELSLFAGLFYPLN